ncbi:hypothetical protein Back11_24170 [Paenibacillus baekrokdamisoli]|uniref:Uncharacterized protein n=1 Tax=Paenibacillus baekrokdamisoli TaxID=1712516 RepID=A0A3G9IRZ3_9BACL|nr:hypothetical protein [Paenibacillus baekrokdamisoli]BBH21072.1 hypothetical protein Back11_24170 [Paenibacillus baekrokdamisoli]
MKQYSVASQLILVGKAWEIRHQLKQLSKQNSASGTSYKSVSTLGEYLENRRPVSR